MWNASEFLGRTGSLKLWPIPWVARVAWAVVLVDFLVGISTPLQVEHVKMRDSGAFRGEYGPVAWRIPTDRQQCPVWGGQSWSQPRFPAGARPD